MWPNITTLRLWNVWKQIESENKNPMPATDIDHSLLIKRKLSLDEVDAIKGLLRLDPAKRASAEETMQHKFFNGVRAFAEHHLPAAPIPPTSLVACGDVLISMELPPIGDYLAKALEKKRAEHVGFNMYFTLFDWLYDVNVKYKNPMSTLIMAVTMFHRFAAAKTAAATQNSLIQGYGIVCYMIATKLDADGSIEEVMDAKEAHYITNKFLPLQTYIDMEREVLATLDLDLDRPNAATFLKYFSTESGSEVTMRILWFCCVMQYDIFVKYKGSQLVKALIDFMNWDTDAACFNRFITQYPDVFTRLPAIKREMLEEGFRNAASSGSKPVVEALLDHHGVNVNAKNPRNGKTALQRAMGNHREHMIAFLRARGAT
jgi:hypothetical protein